MERTLNATTRMVTMPARVMTSMSLIKRKSNVSRLKIPDKVSSYFIDLKFIVKVCVWEHVSQWLGH